MPSAEPTRDPGGPAAGLARVLARALRPRFSAVEATAVHLAELLLDATEAALQLDRGGDAGAALAQLELLAQSADVFAWDGPPGWDVLLLGGLKPRAPLEPGPAPLDGLGAARTRDAQRAALHARARAEAARFLARARAAAASDADAPQTVDSSTVAKSMDSPDSPDSSSSSRATALVAAHASLLRLLALAAAAPSVSLPAAPGADQRLTSAPGAEARLCAEIDARAAVGSEVAAAHDEWLARLQHDNPEAAAHPVFRTFFAGLSQALRLALALRAFRDAAHAGHLPATATSEDPEALIGAIGGFQPVRWAALRAGAPAVLLEALCPPAPAAPGSEPPLERLARDCSAALEATGRLWEARGMPAWEFTGLAGLLFSRTAGALALWQELGGA